jgi:hypothetical protein
MKDRKKNIKLNIKASLKPLYFIEKPAMKRNTKPRVKNRENNKAFISFFIQVKINIYANFC